MTPSHERSGTMTTAKETVNAPPTGHEAGRAARDSVWLVASRIITAILGWAGSIITARSLSVEDWGNFSLVFAVLGLMAIFTDLGVGRAVLGRLMTSETRQLGEIATSFIALRIVLGLLGYGIAIGYTVVTGQDSKVVVATIVAGVVVALATPSHALMVLYQARMRMRVVAVGDIISQFMQLSAIAAVAVLGGNLVWFVVPAVINEVVNLVWRARGVARGDLGFRPTWSVKVSLWGVMLRESVPLTIGFALVVLLSKVDILMLERLDGPIPVGEYAIAYKFSDVLSLAVLAAIQPVTALLVAAWPDDLSAFRARFSEATGVLAFVSGLGVVAFVPVAGPVIELLYGAEFGNAAHPARLLFLASAVTAVTQLCIQTLIAADFKIVLPIIAAVGLLLNVVLNLWAIPQWSTMGAAGATVVTEVVILVAFWVSMHRCVGWPWGLSGLRHLGVGALAAVIAVAGYVVGEQLSGWLWIVVAITTMLVYLAAAAVALSLLDPRTASAIRHTLAARINR